jgi:hypothetical protein
LRLPFADQAIVAEAKLVDYLLNLDHPEGEGKAQFFLAAGFRRDAPQELREALLDVARAGEMVAKPHPYGTKFEYDGPLRAPNGEVQVRVIWLLDDGQPPPRLVTAHPLPRRS